jgi:hypothetical protein
MRLGKSLKIISLMAATTICWTLGASFHWQLSIGAYQAKCLQLVTQANFLKD